VIVALERQSARLNAQLDDVEGEYVRQHGMHPTPHEWLTQPPLMPYAHLAHQRDRIEDLLFAPTPTSPSTVPQRKALRWLERQTNLIPPSPISPGPVSPASVSEGSRRIARL